MKTFIDGLKKGLGHGLGIFIILGIGGIIYASVGSSWTNPDDIIASSGTQLSSTSWNKMLANFNLLKINSEDTKTLNYSSNGIVFSTGWTTIPGLTSNFDIIQNSNITIIGNGGQRTKDFLNTTFCHQSYRVLIDGIPTGDATYGNKIHSNRGDINYWLIWNILYGTRV